MQQVILGIGNAVK